MFWGVGYETHVIITCFILCVLFNHDYQIAVVKSWYQWLLSYWFFDQNTAIPRSEFALHVLMTHIGIHIYICFWHLVSKKKNIIIFSYLNWLISCDALSDSLPGAQFSYNGKMWSFILDLQLFFSVRWGYQLLLVFFLVTYGL